MRTFLLLLFIAGTASPGFAATRVTVQQLERLVAAANGKTDTDVARKLSGLELTERLSTAREVRLEKSMPGPMSRGELIMVADSSAFLRLPADEIPATASPEPDAQRLLLDSASRYAEQALSKMPNFFATREVLLFMDTPPEPGTRVVPADLSLFLAARSSATVFFRDGKQVVETEAAKGKKSGSEGIGLMTSGEFGPILGTLLADARQGNLTWSHWERGASAQKAVFQYVVPREKSHYEVKFCCVSMKDGGGVFQHLSGYHGEITIDPETGSILRLTMQADLKPAYPVERADLMVEYGPVEIGGKSYICPVKSVAIARGYERVVPDAGKEPLNFGGMLRTEDEADAATRGSETLQMLLDDVTFGQYHLFRAETRILTGDDKQPSRNPPDPIPASAQSTAPSAVHQN